MEMTRTREPLSAGTIIRMPDGFCCQITGPIISEGGGGIIYPVSRIRIDADGVHLQEMEYALKECFPLSAQHRLHRREDGAIVAEDSDDQGEDYLAYVKKMQLAERDTTSRIYHTAFRMVPTVESAEKVELSFDEGRSFHTVENAMTVMESLAGKGMTIQAFLDENSRGVSALVALRIVQQVLYALREVHDAGYVHLDIQDGNVLLQGNLNDGSIQATLIDFGSARPLQEDGCTAPISDRALFSTRGFSAPEMARNDGTLRLGPQADLYSTGYLLLFLLTGTRYDPRSLADVRGGRVLTAMRMRHTQCPAHLQGSLQSLLQKALVQDPAERYATADEMLRDVTVLADALAPKQSELAAVVYDAFICYRHNERDDRAAATLRHAIEHYRIPPEVQKATGKERFDRVFLDTDELSSCANLGAAIHDALVSASWLIVVCSPETPGSPWVAQEIDTFLEHHDASHILAVLTAGEPSESFPERLKADSRDDMVFAADARVGAMREMEKTIRRDTVLRVAAPMLGVSYDALKQRRRAWELRRMMIAFGVVLAVALAFLGVVWQDNLRIQEEYANAQVRESHYLAKESQRLLFDEGNRFEAIRTALEALPVDGQGRPYVAEAELALSEALRHYYPWEGVYYDTALDAGGEVTDICISDDLKYLTIASVVVEDTAWVSTWNPDTGEQLWKKRLSDMATALKVPGKTLPKNAASIVRYVPGADALVVASNGAVAGVDAGTGEVLWNKDIGCSTDDTYYDDGVVLDVQIPHSEDVAADAAYLLYLPGGSYGLVRIDTINVADGSVKRSVDVNMFVGENVGYSNILFRIAPSQDYALLVVDQQDGDSACHCVNTEDGSIVSSDTLEGLPMDARVYEDEGLHEDWFVTTFIAGVDDETPGKICLARIEKAAKKGKAAGRSWLVELSLSQVWSTDRSLGRSKYSTFAHNFREMPTVFQFRQYVSEDGDKSGKLVLAVDHDILVVDEDSGEVSGHESADSAVVGYQWGCADDEGYPWLVYADGGIDPFFVSRASSYNSGWNSSDADGNPLYKYKLDDDLLFQVWANGSTEGENVCAVVSANNPTVVKTVGKGSDKGKAYTTVEPYEWHGINEIALNARGDYLCVLENSYADAAADVGESPTGAEATKNMFVLFETWDWRERAHCEADANFDRLLCVTADGSHVVWQDWGEFRGHNGAVWLTELATGETEILPGLYTIDSHYAASVPDAESGATWVAVLSDEGHDNYSARLYRDGVFNAVMRFSLPINRVDFDYEQSVSPLILSPAGKLAFRCRTDKGSVLYAFVDFANKTVFTMESPVANNSPADTCLSRDGLWYASADSDGVVRICDTRDGSLVCSYVLESGAVCAMSFIADDRQLALYTEDNALTIFDVDSGEVVSRIPSMRSREYESYLATGLEGRDEVQQDDEYYLSLESAYHNVSFFETDRDLIMQTGLREGYVIDRETMAVRGYVPGMVGYSASSDALLVNGPGNTMLAYPTFTLEDLIAEGNDLLAGNPSTEANGEGQQGE